MASVIGRAVAAVLVVTGLAVFAIPPTAAQELQNLVNQVNQLHRAMQDLQRQVYGGASGLRSTGTATPVTQAPLSGGAAALDDMPSIAARTEVRLQQLEAQIRNLTGQFERLAFKHVQTIERLDRLVADIDFRLQELDGSNTGSATGSGDRPPQVVSSPAAADQQSQPAQAGTAKPRVLGNLTQSDIEQMKDEQGAQKQADRAPRETVAKADGSKPEPVVATPAQILPDGTPREKYRYAFGFLKKQEFAKAEQAFTEFLAQHRDDPLASNVAYWLGETHYAREDYAAAAVAFADGYQSYPASPKTADNLLKLAMSLARLQREEDACFAFARLAEQFPNASTNIKRRAEDEKKRLRCRG